MIKWPKLTEPGTDVEPESTETRLVVRKCRACEWQGEVIEGPGEVNDCPWCHRPTDVVKVAPPRVISRKNDSRTASLVRLGGSKGGQARAAALTPRQRRAIAMKAANARWSKTKRSKP